ncbi:hypothetical protein SAMN04487783_1502 [Agrococcus baldri]|uniref:Uncharacterized protein n=1 Tax=Agrococcus baldri TaxID=153730 RepID=A0AA94HMG8_9MICO|nr:hypothetical protein [Agrococcus baldri]SFS11029.1 hypothetical protein SAMN04487783_1502 [Agrococcus baldri]
MSSAADRTPEPAWLQRLPEPQRRRMREGSHHADPRRVGASIAIGGGLVFACSYGDGAVAEPWLSVLRIAAVALAALCVWRLFFAPAALGAPATPHRFAWLLYLGSVAAMLAGIAAGRALLAGMDAEHAAGSWIAVCVGAHFVPFAWAFRERMLARLGLFVAGLGVVGVALALTLGEPWGELGAIVAGLAQLGTISAWAMGARRARG